MLVSSHVLSEVAQTVDDVAVIHRGRLACQGAIAELERPSDGGVFVSTPTRASSLALAVRRAGGQVAFQSGVGELMIEGLDSAQVGELAHSERVVLHELGPRGGSLEDVFFSLTEEGEVAA